MFEDEELVGVGIVTCRRRSSYKQLLDSVKASSTPDFIITVKNFREDYGDDEPSSICNGECSSGKKLECIQVDEALGIAHNKNVAAKRLLDLGAKHIFIIEDDIAIKDSAVFSKYITAAKFFNIEHLNFGCTFDALKTHGILKPVYAIRADDKTLDIYNQLSGAFSYFTANALQRVGLYDERYINALDHCEHTYRMAALGFTTPFFAFADVGGSNNMLGYTGTATTIVHDSTYNTNLHAAYKLFEATYGKKISCVKIPTNNDVMQFLMSKRNVR